MRRAFASLLAAAALAVAQPAAAHHFPLLVQLGMPLHAAVAGYFVADYQGYYEEAEIAVSLIPGGPGIDPAAQLASGAANLVVLRMPAALAARDQGTALVNIGQAFARSGLRIICTAASGVAAPADLRGRRLGLWSGSDRYAVLAWLAGVGLRQDQVTLVDQGHDAALLLERRADCISAMSYDEQAQLDDAGIEPAALRVLRLDEFGAVPLEEGFWVPERQLADPDMVWSYASFLYATQRGWEWARANPVEAVRIVQEYDTAKTLQEKPQVRRMREVNGLSEGATERLDPADFARTVDLLLGAGHDRAITRQPDGAWTHAAVDQAGLGKDQ